MDKLAGPKVLLYLEVRLYSIHNVLHYNTYLLLRNNDDPLHFNLPSAIMAIRSPSKSASSLKRKQEKNKIN